jgi:hypothetical protein
LNRPETRLLMAELLAAHRGQVEALVGKALARIDEAMDANVTEVLVTDETRRKTKTGTTSQRNYGNVFAGVDHYARMNGARRLLDMIQAARAEADATLGGRITWEMFLTLRQEAAQ